VEDGERKAPLEILTTMVWGVLGVVDGDRVGCCLTRDFRWGRGGICWELTGLFMVVVRL
jgi:hypothetical protein